MNDHPKNEMKKDNRLVSSLAAGVVGAAAGAVAAVVLTDKEKREKLGKIITDIQSHADSDINVLQKKAKKTAFRIKESIPK